MKILNTTDYVPLPPQPLPAIKSKKNYYAQNSSSQAVVEIPITPVNTSKSIINITHYGMTYGTVSNNKYSLFFTVQFSGNSKVNIDFGDVDSKGKANLLFDVIEFN